VSAGDANYSGPINHVDYSRVGSMGPGAHAERALWGEPELLLQRCVRCNQHLLQQRRGSRYGHHPRLWPAPPPVTSSGTPNLCVGNTTWMARDFMSAPTQFGSVSLSYTPIDKVHANLGYTASAVNGSRFFNDARRCERLDGLNLSVPVCERGLHHASGADLEGSIQLLRLRRGRTLRLAVVQHRNISHGDHHSLAQQSEFQPV